METLKEKWEEVNPVLFGIISILIIIIIIVWGFSKIIPTNYEINENRIKVYNQCMEANLQTIQVDDGSWLCKIPD